MPTNAERILEAISRLDGPSDAELHASTGVEPHQQVNQICHALERRGLVERRRRNDGLIGNFLLGRVPDHGPAAPTVGGAGGGVDARPRLGVPFAGQLPPRESTLIVVPCSGAKARGGAPLASGHSVLEQLEPDRAGALSAARARVLPWAAVDPSGLLPAWRRYSGHLARSASTALGDLAAAGRLVILSGGYGIVLGSEPIAWYDRVFRSSDWPRGLLEGCLLDVARAIGAGHVVAFCSATTGYAKVLRRARWAEGGIQAVLVTPSLDDRKGAMRLAPRTEGFALRAFCNGELDSAWRSNDGISVSMEVLV